VILKKGFKAKIKSKPKDQYADVEVIEPWESAQYF
jgi:hypothetical protein